MYYDVSVSDDESAGPLFEGQLFVYVSGINTLVFVEFSRKLMDAVFAPHDLAKVQREMPMER